MPQSEADRDPHFVGWLPMPRSYSRILIPVAAGSIVSALLVAALVALAQRSPGDGKWEDEKTTTLVGVVYSEPYAMIRVSSEEFGSEPVTVLLVEAGKFGAKDRVRPHDGQPVRVTGTMLSRGAWRMLELSDEPGSLAPTNLIEEVEQRLRRSAPRDLGRIKLKGEIVDSKCFLGAMKPGGGKPHTGCAILCLKGSIPPLLVVAGTSDAPILLTSSDGGASDPRYIEQVGEPVELEGLLQQWDDLRILKVARNQSRGG